MNKTNILAVADAIEQHTIPWLGFNMLNYKTVVNADMSGHNCGTTACIAGWANAIRLRLKETHPSWGGWCEHDGAADWLGIETYSSSGDSTADKLFYARNHPDYKPDKAEATWASITAEQAVRTLRHLAETGEVDWTV